MKLKYSIKETSLYMVFLIIFHVLSYIFFTSGYAFLSVGYLKNISFLLFFWYVVYVVGAAIARGGYKIFFIAVGANYFINSLYIFFFYSEIAYWFNG